MKPFKIAIVACCALGLLALIFPFSGRSLLEDYLEIGRRDAIVSLAIFVLPGVMAALALARAPMRAWQSGVALAGFVLGVVRFRVWELGLHPTGLGLAVLLVAVAIVVGAVASIAMLMRPEAA